MVDSAPSRPDCLEGFGPIGSWKLGGVQGKGTPQNPGSLRKERKRNPPGLQPSGPTVHLKKSVTWLDPWTPS